MADPKELANKARATLASALEALQKDNVPEKLMDIAEPIAKTMGILHRVQKDESTKAEVKTALEIIRTTLDQLQTIEVDHPSVDEAMEGVAGSLSKLFALSRAMPEKQQKPVEKVVEPPTVRKPSGPPRASDKPAPKSRPAPKIGQVKTEVIAAAPIQAIGGSNEPVPPAPQPAQPVAPQPAHTAPIPAQQPQPAVQQPQPAVQAPQPAFAAPAPQPAPQTGFQNAAAPNATVPIAQAAPMAQPPMPAEFGQTLPVNAPSPLAQQPAAQPAAPRAERVPGMTDAPVPATGAKRVEVELGAHSGSNFYKGLSGNDVVEHGGIFVATYQVPKVGDPIALRVLFPGDLEFEGDCIVQWTREVRGEGSEPGFGAKFTRISGEGRQLVYRYVRNREPMFYDDM